MNKLEKGISALAVLALVNPATIVSAATSQQQAPVKQTQTTTKANGLPADELHHISNMFVDPAASYVAYSGLGGLELHLYSSEKTQYLGNVYVVIPKGLKVEGGLAAVQSGLAAYIKTVPIHNGTLTAQQLANTSDGREVYEIIPTTGSYVVTGEYPENTPMTVPIRATDQSSGLTKILFNANTINDIDKDILFIGAGDGQKDLFDDDGGVNGGNYPRVTAASVGISGQDQYVRGIAYAGIQRSVQLFTPKVEDQYNVVDPYTQKPIKHKVITGDSGQTYSRVGQVDTLAALGLNSAIYDEKSLTIDQGTLTDSKVIWTPINGFTNDPNAVLEGQTYTISVKKFAKDVTVKYVDQDDQVITNANGDTTETLSGDVGDAYQTTQKALAGYTFKKAEGNTTGQFSDSAQTVIYHYAKKAANVTVKYVDQDGQVITDANGDTTETLTGDIGDDYQSVQKDLSGYTFKKVDGATSGPFTANTQTITYHYAKKAANVTVKYVDQDSQVITDANGDTTETLTGDIGDDYQSVQKDLAGYTFKKVDGSPSGPFTANAQTITYHYVKKAANVTVKYVDQDGQPIINANGDSTEILTGNLGEDYQATQKVFAGYTFKGLTGAPTGPFTENAQTVTYHYAKIAANVTVNYEDELGNPIADTVILSGHVGEPYQATQAKLAGYTFKLVKGQPTGTFGDVAQTVTYVYTKDPVKAADVTVNYQDENGQPIAKSEILSGNIGDAYHTMPKAIAGYSYQAVTGITDGLFSAKAQTVTYVYVKDPVKAADVTVKYEDESGQSIASTETLSGNVGEPYKTFQKQIAGYTFKTVADQNATGKFSDQAQTVTYVYTKDPVKAADVTVKYEDEAGNLIADTETLSGHVGDAYHTMPKTIAGYSYKSANGVTDGLFSTTAQTVTYVYAKDSVKAADVTVKYEDEAGNSIASSETLSGNIGETYTAKQKEIAGYTFKTVADQNATGKFGAKAQTVTYVYTKDPVKAVDVTVKYEDDAGHQIASSETLTGNIGETYTAKQKEIAGYTFKTVADQNATGKFSAKAQTVTYVYTKDPVKAADVTVKYEDEAGNSIAGTETLSGNIGESYKTVQKDITGYTFKTVADQNATGKFSAKAQTVTYVYSKNVNKPEQPTPPSTKPNGNHGHTADDQQATKPGAKDQQRLPQTGVVKASGLLAAVGMLLITGVGLVFRKRRN